MSVKLTKTAVSTAVVTLLDLMSAPVHKDTSWQQTASVVMVING